MSPAHPTGAAPRAFRRLASLTLLTLLLPACSALRRPLPAPDRTDDPRIRADVEARIAAEPSLDAGAIRVEVDGRTVLLHGSVAGLGAWRCALANAELVEGVRSVVDFLHIQRGPREVQCLAPRAEATDGGGDPPGAAG